MLKHERHVVVVLCWYIILMGCNVTWNCTVQSFKVLKDDAQGITFFVRSEKL